MARCKLRNDSWWWAIVGFWVGLLVVPGLDRITPYRDTPTYRHAMGLMPFRDVAVEDARPDGAALVVRGRMTKMRCTFVRMTASVERDHTGRWDRGWVDTAREGAEKYGGNRPPGVQSWGPWTIRVDPDPRDPPTRWQIWAHHQCPEDDGGSQVNLFAEGAWPR